MKSAPTEAESYATTSARITGGAAIVIGAVCLVDIAVEWRTRNGLITAAMIALAMVIAYVGLIRPSVTLSPERLVVRNHLRDHLVPWSHVQGVDVTDALRIQLPGRRLRCPGVQLVMRDMRRHRAGRVKDDDETSVSRASFVISRIEHHREHYTKTSTGQHDTRWAIPELALAGALSLVGVVAWLT